MFHLTAVNEKTYWYVVDYVDFVHVGNLAILFPKAQAVNFAQAGSVALFVS